MGHISLSRPKFQIEQVGEEKERNCNTGEKKEEKSERRIRGYKVIPHSKIAQALTKVAANTITIIEPSRGVHWQAQSELGLKAW